MIFEFTAKTDCSVHRHDIRIEKENGYWTVKLFHNLTIPNIERQLYRTKTCKTKDFSKLRLITWIIRQINYKAFEFTNEYEFVKEVTTALYGSKENFLKSIDPRSILTGNIKKYYYDCIMN